MAYRVHDDGLVENLNISLYALQTLIDNGARIFASLEGCVINGGATMTVFKGPVTVETLYDAVHWWKTREKIAVGQRIRYQVSMPGKDC